MFSYVSPAFVDELRRHEVTPHMAKKIRYSAIDGRTTRHLTYMVSQRMRKRVEEIFGWLKTVGMTRRSDTGGCPEWAGSSPSHWPLTTLYGSGI